MLTWLYIQRKVRFVCISVSRARRPHLHRGPSGIVQVTPFETSTGEKVRKLPAAAVRELVKLANNTEVLSMVFHEAFESR